MTDYSPFSPQHRDSSTPSSRYMESCKFADVFKYTLLARTGLAWTVPRLCQNRDGDY